MLLKIIKFVRIIPPSWVVPVMGLLAGPLAMLLKALMVISYLVKFLKPVS